MRYLVIGVFLVVVSVTLQAQFPIGHATPVGGYTPALGAEPLWLGNVGYGYRVTGAPPGSAVIVALSTQRVDQVIFGLQVYVDAANLLITHTGTVDATGQAFLPAPLGGPDVPELAGFEAWAQAAVTDPASPGSLGATEGLLLELTLHPVFALLNNTTSLMLVDALTSVATTVGGFPAGTTIADLTFGNGGRDLFIAANNGVFVVDTLAVVPTAVQISSNPTNVNSLTWDRVHHRLYALSAYNGIVTVIDGDRASAAFGTPITQFLPPGFPGWVDISTDGSVLAVVGSTGSLERRNGDPSSASYLQVMPTPPTPITLLFGSMVRRPHVSPDGRVVSIPVDHQVTPVSEIHRFDGVSGQWIDYDPALAGYQPLSHATHTGVPGTFAMFPSRDGRSILLAGGPSARLDLDLADPAHVVVSGAPIPGPYFQRTYLALSPSGRFAVYGDHGFFGPPQPLVLSLVEVATGGITPWVTLPSSIPTATPHGWR